jgi:hypothetical protein
MNPIASRLAAGLAITALVMAAAGPAYGVDRPGSGRAQLQRFAQLPALTFVSGSEPSGSLLGTTPVNGVPLPFADQPVQGFSGIVHNRDGTFETLSDNGYGNKANSSDFFLRIHRIAPDFRTGTVDVVGGINLTDPHSHIPFPLTRPDRLLTGADIDVESMVRLADGSYWMGDEFGPFLLHFDRAGRLLAPPVPLPGVFAPEHPDRGDTPPNLGSSRGFEGIGLSPDRRTLYPLLEGTVAGDPAGSLRLNEFSLATFAYTGRTWRYQLESTAHAIGDVAMVNAHQLLVIERDNGQGADALFKRIYLADMRDRNGDGTMDKTLVADLLNIANPHGIGGFGDPFRFPFITIEDVLILDDRTLLVANDNNLPFSSGRNPGRPDNNELIVIRLGRGLDLDRRVLG